MKKTNTIVVGQGIAGTLAAFMLYRNKISFTVIDPGYPNTASRIAAGMFTPVSGKRKTIHPISLQQIPYAIEVYRAMEQLTGSAFLHLDNIYQVCNTVAEKNEVHERLRDPDFARFVRIDPDPHPGIRQGSDSFEILNSGWVDCEQMIDGFSGWLIQNNLLIRDTFLYEQLRFDNAAMHYQGWEFNNIIFCEGYRATRNPFFTEENIIPCKGDLLMVTYNYLTTERIIKKNGIYFIPVGKNVFRAGATYRWGDSSTGPNDADRKILEGHLDDMLENEYTTINHRSGIRPTTVNREVIARRHPQHTGMFMLNGLGTKGILQGPWWAGHLVQLLLR